MTDIVEQAARVACPNGPDHDHQPNLDQGCNWALQLCQALADAGLLRDPARTVPTRDEIAQAIHDGPGAQKQYLEENIRPHSIVGCDYADQYREDADAVLALLAGQHTVAEVKAQELEEAEELTDNHHEDYWLRERARQIRGGK